MEGVTGQPPCQRCGDETDAPGFRRRHLFDDIISEELIRAGDVRDLMAAEDGDGLIGQNKGPAQIRRGVIGISQLIGLPLHQREVKRHAAGMRPDIGRRDDGDGGVVLRGRQGQLRAVQFGHAGKDISIRHDVMSEAEAAG